MRKVCPQCNGKGKITVWFEEALGIDAACLDCDETAYIDLSADSNETVVDTP